MWRSCGPRGSRRAGLCRRSRRPTPKTPRAAWDAPVASIAHAQPLVHPTPRVAFLGSGDEIADIDQRDEILAGRKIATSNSYTLFGMITHAGAVPVNAGVARDTTDSLREHFARARGADLIVTTAGVSVREHDLVRALLAELGCGLKVDRG